MHKLLVPALLACSLASSGAFAAGSDNAVGFQFGPGFATDNGVGTRPVFGLDAYHYFGDTLGVGLSMQTAPRDVGGKTRHMRLMGGELNLDMPSILPGFYVGGSVGFVGSATHWFFLVPDLEDLYLGPKAGIEGMLGSTVSIGGEAKFLYVTGSPSFLWLEFLGTIRYHF